jgi:micrococcal nuclease
MRLNLGIALIVLAIAGCSQSSAVVPRTVVQRSPEQATAQVSSAPSPEIQDQGSAATIVSTGDGDTLRVRDSGDAVTVRLACIDAPESDQSGGQAAATRLKALLPTGQEVRLRKVDTDRYGRTVAELYSNGESVNLTLVREGVVVVYRQYLDGCADSRDQYLQAEQTAKSSKLGVWGQQNFVMPWDWRRNKREGQAATSEASSSLASPRPVVRLNACTSSDCDCGDFSTQAEAQLVFDAVPGDPHKLDGDQDGRVCERLP